MLQNAKLRGAEELHALQKVCFIRLSLGTRLPKTGRDVYPVLARDTAPLPSLGRAFSILI
ncbi:hypothetical protein ANCCAN_05760 [Ancylostoma caninum]|uniref:Uncharacterized protein n=1 Tax=Ancylostoma caninum TaxID=29170 RepID=A0A368GV63_ANCCA|nr:hypothetical protein ANCCAN_05760 [Ancylostoma caninum]